MRREKKEAKEFLIRTAAIRIFAEKGFYYASIYEIAKSAGVATGLIYFYFVNKLDLLLSAHLFFWKRLNELVMLVMFRPSMAEEKAIVKLKAVLTILLQESLADKNSIYLAKVIFSESLLDASSIRNPELKSKRIDIAIEEKKFFGTLDQLIKQGQREGEFDVSIRAGAMRQVLIGAVKKLMAGLLLQRKIGYTREDVKEALEMLVEKFLVRSTSP